MSPLYEVTATWTERYYASLPVEAANEEEARAKGRVIWREQPLDFLGNANCETAELTGFDVEPLDIARRRGLRTVHSGVRSE